MLVVLNVHSIGGLLAGALGRRVIDEGQTSLLELAAYHLHAGLCASASPCATWCGSKTNVRSAGFVLRMGTKPAELQVRFGLHRCA